MAETLAVRIQEAGPRFEQRRLTNLVEIGEFQDVIRRTFVDRDRARGIDGTFRWLVEEVGEVARSIRGKDPAALHHEVGDALAWLASVANLADVDLERAAARYERGCPRCGAMPCECEPR
jgi:NTP pyrophosphatase (non-canonical NTP hydrolase)